MHYPYMVSYGRKRTSPSMSQIPTSGGCLPSAFYQRQIPPPPNWKTGNPNAKGYVGKGSRWLRCSACRRPQPTPHHGSSCQEASLAAHSPRADFRRCPDDLGAATDALEKALRRGSPPLAVVHAARASAADVASEEKSCHVSRIHRAAFVRVR